MAFKRSSVRDRLSPLYFKGKRSGQHCCLVAFLFVLSYFFFMKKATGMSVLVAFVLLLNLFTLIVAPILVSEEFLFLEKTVHDQLIKSREYI